MLAVSDSLSLRKHTIIADLNEREGPVGIDRRSNETIGRMAFHLLVVLFVASGASAQTDSFSAIAAGDMRSSSAVIWTQIRNGDGSTQRSGTATPLVLEISTTQSFTATSLSLSGVTDPENGNTLKLLAAGLAPNTQYFYRFKDGNSYSGTGTFFTTPSSNRILPFKMGFSGDYDALYRPYSVLNDFGTKANPGSMGLRYFVNLGDLIYERDANGSPKLPNLSPSSSAADNQNALNSFYRKYIENVTGVNPDGTMNTTSGQQSTKQLLASTGVYSLLDNHELYNAMISGGAPQSSQKENYLCGDTTPGFAPPAGAPCLNSASNNGAGATYINQTITLNTMLKAFYNTQATAVQIDGLPTTGLSFSNLMNETPTVVAPNDPRSNGTPQNYFARNWGGAARYIQLDDRTYRDARMYNTTPLIADDPSRTMLGMTQLGWFKQQLLQAQVDGVVWKVVAVSTPIDVWLDPDNNLDNKSWIAGYNAERNDIMKFIEDNKISNVVFLTTDDHIARATRLTYQPAGAMATNQWSTTTTAFQLLAGPGGAIGPYENYLDYGTANGVVTTGFGIGTTEKLVTEKNPYIQANGGTAVGLVGLPGLNNVFREESPNAAKKPTSKDFASATTYGYTTLAWDRFANLSVEYHGIDAYPKNEFPALAAGPRLLFGFTVDVPYTIQRSEVVTLTDADRHQFTGRVPDPLFFNSKWTNHGVLDISQTSAGAGFSNYEGAGSLVVGPGTPLKIAERAVLQGGAVYLAALPDSIVPARSTYTILNAAGGLTGTFSSVGDPYPFLQSSLSYDANNVYLTLQIGGFAAQAQTQNQAAVGAVLDAAAIGATGDFATVLGAFSTMNAQQGVAAMNSISGQNYSGFSSAGIATTQVFMTNFANTVGGTSGGSKRVALAEACDVACDTTAPGRWGAWGGALGGFGVVGGTANAGTLTYNLGGFAAGIDRRVTDELLVGVTAGFTSGSQWVGGFSGRGISDTFQAGLYASYARGAVYVDALAAYAYSDNRMQRQITIPGLSRIANGRTGANLFFGQVETGYRFEIGGRADAYVTPFARLQAATATQNAFTESGAGSLDLSVAAQTTNSLRSVLGAQVGGAMDLGWREKLAMQFKLGWGHEYADTGRSVTASFVGAPVLPFTTYGAAPQRDSVVLGLSATTAIADATSVYFRYEGDISSQDSNHALTAGFRMTW